MEDIISIIVNNGTAIGILCYFVYRDLKFTQRLDSTLATLQKSVDNVEEALHQMRKDDKDDVRRVTSKSKDE